MTGYSRQTTFDAPAGDIADLSDIDWTFEGVDTQRLTHGLHPYPARMVPHIPETILSYYKQTGVVEKGDVVYDPFSGSGTTVVEARLAGLNAEANDINPLACLLTLAKSRPLVRGLLGRARRELLDGLEEELRQTRQKYADGAIDAEISDVRDGWFPEPQLYELLVIRDRIDRLGRILEERTEASESDIRDVVRFLRIALSSTTRQVSYQRNGEYKRYRIPKEDRPNHDPDVYALFTDEVADDIERAQSYSHQVDDTLSTTVHYADSREARDVADDSADIVITSPPYGDHRTTVAYGQFSQDSAIVAGQYGYDEMKDVDKTGLGGSYSLEPLDELERWSDALAATLDTLREQDGRAADALDFFTDYYAVIEQVARVLKPGQPVVWVVANRTMSRVNIPTHLITKELCEHLGFEHQQMLAREIPTKTLPLENAPENASGVTGDLMAEESIVMMTAPTQ
jgi:site-specific DNA-methyltransferase (cytosine-N4-specific)